MLRARTDCIGTNMLSGDGGNVLVSTDVWLVTKTPAPGWTQTLAQEEQCTLGEKMLDGAGRGGTTAFLGWHKMQALPCRTCGFKGRRSLPSSPFCFSALQNSWTEQRLSVLIWLPARHRVLQTSTHLCFSHQCVLVQYDGCLMLKQDRYYDLGRIFFLPMVSIFYTIFLTCAEQIDALCEYSMTNLY